MGNNYCRYFSLSIADTERKEQGRCPEIIIPVDQLEHQNIDSEPHQIGYKCKRKEWTIQQQSDHQFWRIRLESCANCKEIGPEHLANIDKYAHSSSHDHDYI
jgi:hypothetical protein